MYLLYMMTVPLRAIQMTAAQLADISTASSQTHHGGSASAA